jgi:hypothetical protein
MRSQVNKATGLQSGSYEPDIQSVLYQPFQVQTSQPSIRLQPLSPASRFTERLIAE